MCPDPNRWNTGKTSGGGAPTTPPRHPTRDRRRPSWDRSRRRRQQELYVDIGRHLPQEIGCPHGALRVHAAPPEHRLHAPELRHPPVLPAQRPQLRVHPTLYAVVGTGQRPLRGEGGSRWVNRIKEPSQELLQALRGTVPRVHFGLAAAGAPPPLPARGGEPVPLHGGRADGTFLGLHGRRLPRRKNYAHFLASTRRYAQNQTHILSEWISPLDGKNRKERDVDLHQRPQSDTHFVL